MKFEFGPNLDSRDLLQLFTEDWTEVRNKISALHLNMSHGRPGHDREPNTFGNLVQVNAFGLLRDWNLLLILEGPALKGWPGNEHERACNGEIPREQLHEAVSYISIPNGLVSAIEFDEPLTAGLTFCGHSIRSAAAITAMAIRELNDRGVASHLIEAYPFISADKILQFVTELHRIGWLPPRVILDIDPRGFSQSWWDRLWHRPYGLKSASIKQELRSTTQQLRGLGVEVGVVIIGGVHPTDAAYREDVLLFNSLIRDIWNPEDLDVLIIRNWAEEMGIEGRPRSQPDNFPLDNPNSHLGILQAVMQAWTTL